MLSFSDEGNLIEEEDDSGDEKFGLAFGMMPDEYDPSRPNICDEHLRKKPVFPTRELSQNAQPIGPSPFAVEMMFKMGWRQGGGLGREGQGITAPLVHEAWDSRAGIIKPAAPINIPIPQQAQQRPSRKFHLHFDNRELTPTLIDEITEEAAQFGNLLDVSRAAESGKDLICEVRGFTDKPQLFSNGGSTSTLQRFSSPAINDAVRNPDRGPTSLYAFHSKA